MVDFKKGGIRQQIEAEADYVPGGTYAFDTRGDGDAGFAPLLTFYKSLELQGDPLSNQFIPLSAVAQQGRNPKLFAIGILPPTNQVTGRLLDRSETLIRRPYSQLNGEEEPAVPPFEYPAPPSPYGVSSANVREKSPASERTETFWRQYVAMCRRIKQDPVKLGAVLYLESGFDPGAQNKQQGRIIAQGLNQYTRATALNPKVGNMTPEEWDNFGNLSAEEQLPYVEKYFRGARANSSKGQLYRRNFGGYENPDGSIYASKEQQAAWIAAHPGAVFQNANFQNTAIQQNSGFVTVDPATGAKSIKLSTLEKHVENLPPRAVRAAIESASQFIDDGGAVYPLPVPPDAETAALWAKEGEARAQASLNQEAKLANTDINATVLGQSLMAAQKAMVKALQAALTAMAATPPLRMLVNPSKFAIKSQKITQYGAWSRNGPIVEFWGDAQDKISGAGTVAGFYALDSDPGLSEGGPGLTRTARNFSQSWQNFQSLFLIYKNNGGLHLQDLSQSEKDLLLATVGSVYLYYDNIIYIGSFDSFNVTESDMKPFSAEYSFEFSVRATFLLEYPDEASYGAPGLFSNKTAASIPSSVPYNPPSRFVQEQGSVAAASTVVSESPKSPGTT